MIKRDELIKKHPELESYREDILNRLKIYTELKLSRTGSCKLHTDLQLDECGLLSDGTELPTPTRRILEDFKKICGDAGYNTEWEQSPIHGRCLIIEI